MVITDGQDVIRHSVPAVWVRDVIEFAVAYIEHCGECGGGVDYAVLLIIKLTQFVQTLTRKWLLTDRQFIILFRIV